MACSRARRLSPVLALLVVAVYAALGHPQTLGVIGEETPHATSLSATSPGVEAVLPLKLEQAGDRVGHPNGGKHRLPLGLAVVAVGLPAFAAAIRAGRRSVPRLLQAPWCTTPPSRGPPALRLLAT